MAHSLGILDRGLAQPTITDFWKIWRRDRSLAALPQVLRRCLTLSCGYADDGVSPSYLSVGRESFVARCFGADWARDAILQKTTPDGELERLAAPGYHTAIAGDPNLDVVSCLTQDDDGRTMQLLYERFIVPMPTLNGTMVVACLTVPLEPIKWLSGQDDLDRWDDSSTDSRRDGYVMAPESSQSQQAMCERIPDGPQSPWPPVAVR